MGGGWEEGLGEEGGGAWGEGGVLGDGEAEVADCGLEGGDFGGEGEDVGLGFGVVGAGGRVGWIGVLVVVVGSCFRGLEFPGLALGFEIFELAFEPGESVHAFSFLGARGLDLGFEFAEAFATAAGVGDAL